MADLSRTALDIEDLRRMARRRLTKGIFDFIDRGSEDDVALRHNRAALERIKLRGRVLVDVSKRDPGITLFGKPQRLPLVVAPTGPAGYVWYRGETAIAKAAARAGVPFTLASTSNTAMEKILADGGGRQWFQLYVWRDLEQSVKTAIRAREAGFDALVLTVDSIVYYNRRWDIENGMVFPVRMTPKVVLDALMHPRWLVGTMGRYWRAERGLPRYVNIPVLDGKPLTEARSHLVKNDTMTWDFVKRMRDLWPRTLILKGLQHPADALLAADCGVDGVVISNHGGISSDGALAPIDALPGFVAAAKDRITLIVDSGFRRGSEVLKAMALGADAVMVGRAPLYGAATAGEDGSYRALEILEAEITRTMAMLGVNTIDEIGREHVLLPSEMA
jgi:isopentenyl diphosphate isomerase/L-lactate dehydrogenase-like FMN-dependent dehydrogenase